MKVDYILYYFHHEQKKAKKFIKWVRNDVLPLMRQNNIFPSDTQITKLQKKINELEKRINYYIMI
jgi:prophage antirepressor-like protein